MVAVSFDHLDPVTASELLHEVDKLAHLGTHPAYAESSSGEAIALNER